MHARTRRLLIGGALAATVVASVYPVQEDAGEVVAPAARRAPQQQAEATPSAAAAEAPQGAIQVKARTEPRLKNIRDPFAGAAPVAPPPPPVQAAPPPAPQAPPMPFSYRGKLVEEGNVLVILAGRTDTYVAKVGDVIEQSYRIDEVSEETVKLTYLPLNEPQSLRIDESKP
jgi:hypothetical protein